MTAWLPHPILSASLLITWLVLNQTVSAGHVLLAVLLGLAGGRIMAVLQPDRSRLGRPAALARLVAIVIADVIRSNLAVAGIILAHKRGQVTSGFVEIPLALRDPAGLALLACIITATPGTLWIDHDPVRCVLTIHVLDLVDEGAWVDLVKHRYERLLLEIFA
jgi:multicomponent K+:H+ antiporter subunit E